MTFYVILQKLENGWEDISDPDWYLSAKRRMYELKKQFPNNEYRLYKTSY